jgi:hypothetical protein
MHVIWKAAAVLLIGIVGVSRASSAQDEPVPSYATAFDLEQTVENLTVRVLWASADIGGIEVAWIQTFDLAKPGIGWSSELLHEGVVLHPSFSLHPLSTMSMTMDAIMSRTVDGVVFAILKPSDISAKDSVTLELRFTGTLHNNGTPVPDSPQETMSFLLEVPFHHIQRWSGEQIATANGISMTLHAAEYLPSETYLTVCFPQIASEKYPGLELAPYIDDPLIWMVTMPVGNRERIYSIPLLTLATPAMLPEVTDEADFAPDSMPGKCVDLWIVGLIADTDGMLHVTIDELRTEPRLTAAALPDINAALENVSSPWRIETRISSGGWDSFLPVSNPPHPQIRYSPAWLVYENIVSDITSERLLGPWTFSVPLE